MNNHLKKSILPLGLSVLIALGIFVGHIIGENKIDFFSIPKLSALQEVKILISKRYLEDINRDSLTSGSIDSVLMELDPHSRYISASNKQTEIDGIKGMFYGIGVEYIMLRDSLNIVQVLAKSPAEFAGVQVGDIVLKAGNSLISNSKKTAAQIRNSLTGERGSELSLTIKRSENILQLIAQRREVDVNSIDAAFMIAAGTGYIKINRFTSKTYREFMFALMELKKQVLNKLILDLRDNGGGVLEEAVEIADEFLEGDKLISYTQGFHSPKKEYRCRRLGQFEKGKLIILSNENTASASEILMGALQDWDRATIIGKRSFGKGLLQEQYNLNDGGALRLTIAKYYTPLGRSIQRSYSQGKTAYYDGAKMQTDTTLKDNRQLTITKSGKKLYDHSGISPEFEISNDNLNISDKLISLFADEASKNFGYFYFAKHREIKTKFPTFESFKQAGMMDDTRWEFYQGLVSKNNKAKFHNLSAEEKKLLAQHLESSLAAQLYGRAGYYKSTVEVDKLIQKAIAL